MLGTSLGLGASPRLGSTALYIACSFLVAGLALHIGHVESQPSDPAAGHGAFKGMGCAGCHSTNGNLAPLDGTELPRYSHESALLAIQTRLDGKVKHPSLRAMGTSVSTQNIRNLAAFISYN